MVTDRESFDLGTDGSYNASTFKSHLSSAVVKHPQTDQHILYQMSAIGPLKYPGGQAAYTKVQADCSGLNEDLVVCQAVNLILHPP